MRFTFLLALVLLSQSAFARTKFIEITPVISTSAYTANDTVGAVNTVYSLTTSEKPIEALGSLIIVDKAKQKADLDLCFYSSSPTVSADNAAFDLTDAMALKTIGCVAIAAADYIDSSSNSTATKRGLSLLMPQSGGQTIFAVLVTRGTPTYGSTSDLVLRMAFYEESQ